MSDFKTLGALGVTAAVGAAIGYMYAKRPSVVVGSGTLTIGYWKIRGLAAPLRMMCFYKKQPFNNVAFGEDAKDKWFGGAKPQLAKKNALINLPHVIDGDTIITQSNSCLIYLGQRLGIDKPEHAVHNHQVLDQVMDLRNDTMKIAYPFSGIVKTKADFPAELEKHMKGATGHFAKLEGHCVGPYMCGDLVQCGDFHVFEMVDQHLDMCAQSGVAFDVAAFPKLQALHAKMRAEPSLAPYFASDLYKSYAFNNAMYAHFVGAGYGDGPFGPTTETLVQPSAL